MESKDEFKETDIKIRTCYCFDNIMELEVLILVIFYWTKNHCNL